MDQQRTSGREDSPRGEPARAGRTPPRSGIIGLAALSVLAGLLAWSGCIRPPRPATGAAGPASDPLAALRAACPPAVSASVRIRLEPDEGPGVTIDGSLLAIPPDTLSLSARLGIFRPFFALRADADSAELLLHDARSYWVTSRAAEDWTRLDPSAWARALSWAICPADLVARLDAVEAGRGDGGLRRLRGRIRGTPFEAELGLDRDRPRLVTLRILDGDSTLLESRHGDFRRSGEAWVPGFLELKMPRHALTARVEVIGLSMSRPGRTPEVAPIRPPGWGPWDPTAPLFAVPAGGAGHDPG